jgi:hypothetical protein
MSTFHIPLKPPGRTIAEMVQPATTNKDISEYQKKKIQTVNACMLQQLDITMCESVPYNCNTD